MRLRFQLSANTAPVPYDYQHLLTGTLHKWLGANNSLHDRISLYTFGWLHGGKATGGALQFPRGAEWMIGFHDDRLAEPLAVAALREPEVCFGMRVTRIEQQTTPEFGARYCFRTASPVLARAEDGTGRIRHLIYSDPEADEVLTATLRHKMDVAGLDSSHKSVRVSFDRTYKGAKTKLVTIKNIRSRASSCPVRVEGTPEAVQFAWNVGIGHSTGSGFGCLLHTGDERDGRG